MVQGLPDIRLHADPALVHDAQVIVGMMVAALGGLAKPLDCLVRIGPRAFAVAVQAAQIILGHGVPGIQNAGFRFAHFR